MTPIKAEVNFRVAIRVITRTITRVNIRVNIPGSQHQRAVKAMLNRHSH